MRATVDRRPPTCIATLIAALVVACFAFSIYRSTLLPGLDLGDTPSFQVMGGSPYISPRDAYPLYFAFAAPFVWWSPDDPARAMNLASAAAAALTCGALVVAGVELSGALGAAVVMALVFGGSYTFWSQAVIAEVYALHMLCTSLVLVAALRWQRRPSTARLAVLLGVFAIAFGNHLTTILLLPGLLLFVGAAALTGQARLSAVRVLAVALVCAALGALQYLWNIRTLLADPAGPTDVVDAARWFWFDVTKVDWREAMVLTLPRVAAGERLRMFAFDLRQQFSWPWLALAALGVLALRQRNPPRLTLLVTWLLATTTFALTYNVGDPHVFLLPGHLVVAVFCAPGLEWLTRAVVPRAGIGAAPLVTVSALALVLARIAGEYPALDRSQDRRPLQALEALTGDLDDRHALLLADLNWQVQNGLNHYAQKIRTDLSVARLADVLPYAPTLIADNHAIDRTVVLTERAHLQLTAAYGPLFRAIADPRVAVKDLAERTAGLSPGTRYVVCLLRPTPEVTWNRGELDRAVTQLTGGGLSTVPAHDYVMIAGLVGQAPVLIRGEDRPFRTNVTLDGLPVQIRMDSWLAFDTIRRMGFGHVIAARHHALILERGVSLVVLAGDGRPLQTEYAAGLYAPQQRFIVEKPPRLAGTPRF